MAWVEISMSLMLENIHCDGCNSKCMVKVPEKILQWLKEATFTVI